MLARIKPLDKQRNANSQRRQLDPEAAAEPDAPSGQMPPLMRKLLREFAATGLPAPYIPQTHNAQENPDE